jgi:hypothetical protein
MSISVRTRDDLVQAIALSWSRDTSNEPDRWTPDNPALGQCAVTALVVQDYLGGRLLRGLVGDVSHYWNQLPTGEELDLTQQQFQDFGVDSVGPRDREYVLSFTDTQRRYRSLLDLVSRQLGGQAETGVRPSQISSAVKADDRLGDAANARASVIR